MLFVNHMTAYELLISDWISDVFSSDLVRITQAAVVVDVDGAVAVERLDQQPDRRLVVLRGLDRVLHHLLAVFDVVDRDDGHAGADAGVERRTVPADRKRVGSGKSVSVRVDRGGRGIFKKKKK